MIKRFFTKKSVAIILATIVLVGFFNFNIADAQTTPTPGTCTTPTPPATSKSYPISPICADATHTYKYVFQTGWIQSPCDTVQLSCYFNASQLSKKGINSGLAVSLANTFDNETNAAVVSNGGKASVKEYGIWDLAQTIGNIFSNPSEFLANSPGYLISGLTQFVVLPIASFFLAVGGSILDYCLEYTIFGNAFTPMAASIQSIWVLVRDTANVCFIFILLYAAISQIVTGVTKKDILVSVIISAMLINFSLFITEVVVDASNLVATSIYTQITQPGVTQVAATAGQAVVAKYGFGTSAIDLSGRLMDSLGLTTALDVSGAGANFKASSLVGVSGLTLSITQLLLFLVTTYVFLFLAMILVGRFVMLIILMATSPIGFIGNIIPGLGTYSAEWRKSLQDQALIAPLFMFLMLLVIKLSQGLKLVTQNATPTIIFFNFFIVVYVLLKTVKIIKGLSGTIGDFAGKIASTGTGIALGTITGGAAILGRETVGRGANVLAKSRVGESILAYGRSGGLGSTLAKGVYKGIEGTAKSSFDVRNTGALKETLGKAEGMAGTGLVSAGFAKGGGTYGKGTGYAGYQAQTSAEALKDAKDAEKSAKDYEQRITNLHPEIKDIKKEYNDKKDAEIKELDKQSTDLDTKKTELSKQKGALEAQLKTADTPEKQNEITEQIHKVTKEADEVSTQKAVIEKTKEAVTKTKNEATLSDVLVSHNEDFSAAEAKIAKFNKMNKDLESGALQLNKMTQEEVDDFENLAKEAKKAEEYKQKNPKISKVLKLGEISTLKKLQDVRKNLAKNYRNYGLIGGRLSLINTLNKSEDLEIAAQLEKEAPKPKTDEDKLTENLAKKVKELQDKDKKENPEEPSDKK